MPISIGVDLGTTTITALAIDVEDGQILSCATLPNESACTSPEDQRRGRSEWNAQRMVQTGFDAIRSVSDDLTGRLSEVAGIGVTGQQHGVVVIDEEMKPITPFINWQDRRGGEVLEGKGQSCLDAARQILGEEAHGRAGCLLSMGRD